MTPYFYEITNSCGFKYTRNLHLDGTVSVHPDYLNWTQDEIIERMQKQVELLANNPQAPTGWLNARLLPAKCLYAVRHGTHGLLRNNAGVCSVWLDL